MKFEKLDIEKVEVGLAELIRKLKIGDKISVAWVRDFTYNFNAPDRQIPKEYFGKLFSFLPKNASEKDFAEAMQVFNDAWNAFPQKIMGGVSPQDKMFAGWEKGREEDAKKNQSLAKSTYFDPKLMEEHFSKAEKDVDKYLDWAGEEVLPNYKKSLENLNWNKIEKRNAVGVAEVLFEICGQLGMLDFRRLPPDFIKDFPNIFKKEVVGPEISKEKVAEYLKNFLLFLEVFYGIETIK
ncbi:MAG: hypothetical protein NTV48_02950 [Candidatus Vogelbacteria bacterium]|nr:hypothetical protein [Candidatus Vogelbacteria bacterium]